MFLYDLLFALFIALIISIIISIPFRKEGLFPGLLFFFFLIFLGAWAGGTWITPFGPEWLDVYWLPFVVMAVLIALLILALTQARPHRIRVTRIGDVKKKVETEEEGIVLGCFFYVFIIFLIIAILIAYL